MSKLSVLFKAGQIKEIDSIPVFHEYGCWATDKTVTAKDLLGRRIYGYKFQNDDNIKWNPLPDVFKFKST